MNSPCFRNEEAGDCHIKMLSAHSENKILLSYRKEVAISFRNESIAINLYQKSILNLHMISFLNDGNFSYLNDGHRASGFRNKSIYEFSTLAVPVMNGTAGRVRGELFTCFFTSVHK